VAKALTVFEYPYPSAEVEGNINLYNTDKNTPFCAGQPRFAYFCGA